MSPDDPRTKSSSPLELPALRSDELAAIAAGAPDVAGLGEVCRHVAATKGKQLRARLVLAAAENGPTPDERAVRSAAAAVEAIHLASLTHDDVIDEGLERRGAPTAVALFGNRRATIAGNWLVGRSVELIARSGGEAARSFAEAAVLLTEGELNEIARLYDVSCTEQHYMQTVRDKTGALFWLSMRLGGLLSGADYDTLQALERYGWEFGTAYQIADDLLDLLTMDRAVDRTGRDLNNGVYTLPLIYALERSDELHDLLESHTRFSGPEVESVLDIVRQTGALERTLDCFGLHAEAAREAMEALPEPHGLGLVLDHLVARCEEAR